MKILYGVVGEGMGHATRSRVVLEHLRARGHEVRIVASHGAATLLDNHFGNVFPIEGMRMVFDANNRICRVRTLLSIMAKGFTGLPRNVAAYFAMLEDGFEPDVVISDFESWTHLYAMLHGIPIISLDNIQIVSRCRMPREVLEGRRWDYFINRALVRTKLPFCDHYLLTSFFKPEIDGARTTIHAPVLRQEILRAKPTDGEHVLVYQSGGVTDGLVASLRRAGVTCRVYGVDRETRTDRVDGNLVHRPFDEDTFIDDLRSARAVVATGGATLMSEALHLGKPVLATPIFGQFEQNMNAVFLERSGYGRMATGIDDATVRGFLSSADRFREALGGYERPGNQDLLSAVDRTLRTYERADVSLEGRTGWASAS